MSRFGEADPRYEVVGNSEWEKEYATTLLLRLAPDLIECVGLS